MKKIDKLVLGAFLGPFLMTFLVVVFILLTQHMLKYFDDIIGKGLGGDVISQLLFYFAIFMTPVALPLAVLLSSLIAFGNLGEHFELTAIKSAGISLVRTLRPIFFFVLLLTVVAFYANNNLVPKAALEAYSLLYDIKQKKPALDLREGAFYNGINDISIKVNKKYPDGISLKDVVVYDHRKNDGNKEVTVADSGKMYTILNERYLKFELFNGYNYAEGGTSQRDIGAKRGSKETVSRSRFAKSQIVFDLSEFQFERTDKKWFQGNRIMRNLNELEGDVDSMKLEIRSQQLNYFQFHPSYFSYYTGGKEITPLPDELARHKIYRDSILQINNNKEYNPDPVRALPEKTFGIDSAGISKDSSKVVADSATKVKALAPVEVKPVSASVSQSIRRNIVRKSPASRKRSTNQEVLKPETKLENLRQEKQEVKEATLKLKKINKDSLRLARIDSMFHATPTRPNYQGASNAARQVKQSIENNNTSTESFRKEQIIFEIQWHKILASSLACVAMFLIGAPLGAIIKKGGLGMPFLVSILFFIIYYVLTMQGEKLAKQGAVSPAVGVWMPDFILFVIGLIFLRQARADARLFEADFYNVVIDKLQRWFKARRSGTMPG